MNFSLLHDRGCFLFIIYPNRAGTVGEVLIKSALSEPWNWSYHSLVILTGLDKNLGI